ARAPQGGGRARLRTCAAPAIKGHADEVDRCEAPHEQPSLTPVPGDSGACTRVCGVSLAEVLALVAAFLFALAAALQQKGALELPTISLANPKSFVRLLGQKMWLIGTLALFSG